MHLNLLSHLSKPEYIYRPAQIFTRLRRELATTVNAKILKTYAAIVTCNSLSPAPRLNSA